MNTTDSSPEITLNMEWVVYPDGFAYNFMVSNRKKVDKNLSIYYVGECDAYQIKNLNARLSILANPYNLKCVVRLSCLCVTKERSGVSFEVIETVPCVWSWMKVWVWRHAV